MCRLRLCGFCAAPRRTSGTTTTLAPLTSRYYTRCDAFGAGGRRFKSSHPDHSFDSGVCFLPPEPRFIRGSDESSEIGRASCRESVEYTMDATCILMEVRRGSSVTMP